MYQQIAALGATTPTRGEHDELNHVAAADGHARHGDLEIFGRELADHAPDQDRRSIEGQAH